MSTINSVGSTSDLANSIIKNYDADKDGSLSKTEFASFLTNLVSGLGAKTSSTSSTSSTTTGTAGLATLYATASNTSTTADETREDVGTMMGFDSTKLADTEHKSLKYEVGRILQYYPNTPAGLQSALAEIQELVPEATLTGTNGDKIDFGDYTENGTTIGVIDVLVGAAAGGKGWAWQPVEE